jgi:hypothetical protein
MLFFWDNIISVKHLKKADMCLEYYLSQNCGHKQVLHKQTEEKCLEIVQKDK